MKKGFTLIELMVVIVIMGVLAAVAVPKLFGLITKAKASELQPAAGTYVHLQEAHIVGNTTIGDWKQIGYAAPVNGNSKNFCYSQGDLKTSIDIASNGEGIIGWGATNKAILNECAANNWWSITINGTDKSSITFKQNVSETNCQTLLANWNVGTTLNGECDNATTANRDPVVPPTENSKNEESKDYNIDNLVWNSENLEKNYTIINGEYKECNNGGNWLNGVIAGQTQCRKLRDLLYENNDLVHPTAGKNNKEQENKYVFNGKESYCLVTRDCSDSEYKAALDARREKLDEEAKAEASGDNSNSGTGGVDNNQSGDNSQSEEKEDDISGDGSDETPKICTDKSHKSCPCEKIGSNGKCP